MGIEVGDTVATPLTLVHGASRGVVKAIDGELAWVKCGDHYYTFTTTGMKKVIAYNVGDKVRMRHGGDSIVSYVETGEVVAVYDRFLWVQVHPGDFRTWHAEGVE